MSSPIHDPDQVTPQSVARICAGLADRSLPKEEWTHAAHVIAATCLVRAEGLAAAETRMPDMIRRFNIAKGGENTDHAGYHHTITLFYLRAIDLFLSAHNATGSAEISDANVCQAVLRAPLSAAGTLERHYTKERLFSVKARRRWVAPDKAPLAKTLSGA